MNWDRWGGLQGNLVKCERYFNEDPCWMRAFQIWRLVHQMAAFTNHPSLIEAREVWKKLMEELDEGKRSEAEAAGKLVSGLAAGLTAGELRRLKKLCTGKPNWRWNPDVLRIVNQVNGRLGQKAHSAT